MIGARAGDTVYVMRSSTITAQPLGTVFDLATEADAIFRGEAVGDYLGHAVASAGDMNGDGKDDLLVSAILADDGSCADCIDEGKTYLIFSPY